VARCDLYCGGKHQVVHKNVEVPLPLKFYFGSNINSNWCITTEQRSETGYTGDKLSPCSWL